MRIALALILWLWCCSIGQAIDALALGCKIGDPEFDNGAILSEAVKVINETITFPGGVYWFKTPANLGKYEAVALQGQGLCIWRNRAAFEDRNLGRSAVIFATMGDGPILRLSGVGTSIKGINLFHGFMDDRPERSGTAIEGAGIENGPPSGKWFISECSINNFGRAIDLKKTANVLSHLDNIVLDHILFGANQTDVYVENNQSATLEARQCIFHGDGIAFHYVAGGNLYVTSAKLNGPKLLLKTGKTGSNTCSFTFENLKADNNAANWRILEMDNAGPINLRVRGHVGERATMGASPLAVKPVANPPSPLYQRIDVDLWPYGRVTE